MDQTENMEVVGVATVARTVADTTSAAITINEVVVTPSLTVEAVMVTVAIVDSRVVLEDSTISNLMAVIKTAMPRINSSLEMLRQVAS